MPFVIVCALMSSRGSHIAIKFEVLISLLNDKSAEKGIGQLAKNCIFRLVAKIPKNDFNISATKFEKKSELSKQVDCGK